MRYYLFVWLFLSASFQCMAQQPDSSRHVGKTAGMFQYKLHAVDVSEWGIRQVLLGSELQAGLTFKLAKRHYAGISVSAWGAQILNKNTTKAGKTSFFIYGLACHYGYFVNHRLSLQLGVTVPLLSYEDNSLMHPEYCFFVKDSPDQNSIYYYRKKIHALIPFQANLHINNHWCLFGGVNTLFASYYETIWGNVAVNTSKAQTKLNVRCQIIAGFGYRLGK